MWHPLDYFSTTALLGLFGVLLVASLPIFVRLESLNRRLRNDVAPWGLISLEISLTSGESEAIIKSWDSEVREDAERQLQLDYIFIPLYSTALAALGVVAARWLADQQMAVMASLATLLAWGQWLAGLFEFAENSALLRTLQMYPHIPERLPQLSGWCARIKFLLIFLAIACCLFGLVTSLA